MLQTLPYNSAAEWQALLKEKVDQKSKKNAARAMGCSAEGFCPAPLLNKTVDWGIEDPKGKPVENVREIRDEIEKKVRIMLDETA